MNSFLIVDFITRLRNTHGHQELTVVESSISTFFNSIFVAMDKKTLLWEIQKKLVLSSQFLKIAKFTKEKY